MGFKKGSVPHNKGTSKVKVGSVFTSVGGYGDYEVLEYISNDEVLIKFLNTGYSYSVVASPILRGKVKDYSVPNVYGIGYNSLGKLKIGNNLVLKVAHIKWKDMLSRCYSPRMHKTNPTYKGCVVSEDWHDFANFYNWFKNINKIEDKLDFHLDKDILSDGSKIYSKENCCLIPRKINNIICSPIRDKDSPTPVGVHLHKVCGRYQSYCNDFKGKRKSLGFHDNLEDAHRIYIKFKKQVLKECADFYKDVIPSRLYDKLINHDFKQEDYYEI